MEVFHTSAAKRHRVCVTPCTKDFNATVSTTTTPQGRGPAHDITTLANEASDVMGSGQRRLTVYLQRTAAHAVQSSFFDSMVFHDTFPQTLFPQPTCSRRSVTEPP